MCQTDLVETDNCQENNNRICQVDLVETDNYLQRRGRNTALSTEGDGVEMDLAP